MSEVIDLEKQALRISRLAYSQGGGSLLEPMGKHHPVTVIKEEILALIQRRPKVKALEWGALSTPEWEKAGIAVRIAKTFFGEYRIRSIPRNGEHIWNGPFNSPESCADYVDAKAAAQADYERRILSALE